MKKYKIESTEGIFYASEIGVNHTADNFHFGGIASSYDGVFDNDDLVLIESGFDMRYCKIGDIKETFEMLKRKLQDKKPDDFFQCMSCVFAVVFDYFGDYTNIKDRLNYFPESEDVDEKDYGKVSDLAHKNVAKCVERAMLSQNLLKTLGYNSIFKISGVVINGKNDAHAYNLIQNEDKYYIFDATIPTKDESMISPIICEISKDAFDKIKSPCIDIGISIHVVHYNPLQDKNYDIVYDAGRKELIDKTKKVIK